MSLRPRWQDHDSTDDYRADATAVIRWEALHTIVSSYSNRDINAYGQASDYSQEIMTLIDFFEQKAGWVRDRFGAAVWDEMMDLASAVEERIKRLEDHFRGIPEDANIHRLRADKFKRFNPQQPARSCFGESVQSGGLWYVASGQSGFEVRDAEGVTVARPEFPEEIWVRDIWVAEGQIYIPCRSYCWPTLFVRYEASQGGFAARSALGHAMDPLPPGYSREPIVPMWS